MNWNDLVEEIRRNDISPEEWIGRWLSDAYPTPEEIAEMVVRQAVTWNITPRKFLDVVYEARKREECPYALLEERGHRSRMYGIALLSEDLANEVRQLITKEAKKLIEAMKRR